MESENKSTAPPPFVPLLTPEGAKKRKKKKPKGPAVVIDAKTEPQAQVPEPPKPPESAAEPEEKTYTLEQAFSYFYDVPADEERVFNIERVCRAVAFLLHWTSEMGNHDVEGRSAAGLGHILEQVASEVAEYPPPEIRYVYRGGPAPKDEPEDTPEAS